MSSSSCLNGKIIPTRSRTCVCGGGSNAPCNLFSHRPSPDDVCLCALRRCHLYTRSGPWGSLYNQVHVSWSAGLVTAIFYVNDTLTPLRYAAAAALAARATSVAAAGRADGRRELHGEHKGEVEGVTMRLQLQAARAAERAYRLARLAQRTALFEFNLTLPIVQYRVTDECWCPDGMIARLKATSTALSWRGAGPSVAAHASTMAAMQLFDLPATP